jgi:hypothetical protein
MVPYILVYILNYLKFYKYLLLLQQTFQKHRNKFVLLHLREPCEGMCVSLGNSHLVNLCGHPLHTSRSLVF